MIKILQGSVVAHPC